MGSCFDFSSRETLRKMTRSDLPNVVPGDFAGIRRENPPNRREIPVKIPGLDFACFHISQDRTFASTS